MKEDMKNFAEPDFGPRTTGQTVPTGFFVDFQKKLEAEIDRQEMAGKPKGDKTPGKPRRKLGFWQSFPLFDSRESRIRWAVAACVCVLIGLYPVFRSTYVEQEMTPLVSSYTNTDVSETVEGQEYSPGEEVMLASLNDYDLYEYMYGTDMD